MNFENVVKNKYEVPYKIITNEIKNNKVPHAHIFSAPYGTDIFEVPMFFIQKLISTMDNLRNPEHYPDLIVIDGSDGIIKKDEVSKAFQSLEQTALDSVGKKFLLIKNIENANKQSINSLLKFIEEPTDETFILMTTNNISSVLPTIRSRSQIVNIRPDSKEDIAKKLVDNGIELSTAKILSSVYPSYEKAINVDLKSFNKLVEKTIEIMQNSLNNNSLIITEFSKLISKKNFVEPINVLREFINDIWRIDQLMPTSFTDVDDLLESYSNSSFDIDKALTTLNDFLISQKHYVNFDLYKNKTLIELKECYE